MKRLFVILVLSLIHVKTPAQTSDNKIIASLQEQRQLRTELISRYRRNMFLYMLDNKAASASIIAAGGGLGAFLQENMDPDTRTAIMIIGVFGLAYCVDTFERVKECAAVGAELGTYMGKIQEQERGVREVDSRLAILTRPVNTLPLPAPNPSFAGTDKAGPFFNSEFPNGVYHVNGAEIQLSMVLENNASRTLKSFDLPSFKTKAEAAKSQLHSANEGFRYVLMERDSLLVLKHDTKYRDYATVSQRKAGIGIEISKPSGEWLRVGHIFRDSPASRAGLNQNDWILSIDGKDTRAMSIDEAAAALSGGEGQSVSLSFFRPEVSKSFTARVARENISYPTTRQVYGYIAIYRDKDGDYFSFSNADDKYKIVPLGAQQSIFWSLGDSTVTINFVRPTTNADRSGREVNYAYSLK